MTAAVFNLWLLPKLETAEVKPDAEKRRFLHGVAVIRTPKPTLCTRVTANHQLRMSSQSLA